MCTKNDSRKRTTPVPDAHCHLDQLSDPDEAILDAASANVGPLLAVGEDRTSSEAVLALKDRYEGRVLAGIGIHPMLSKDLTRESMEEALAFLKERLPMADGLGEVGLDFKYAVTDEQQTFQRELLDRQLDLAAAAGPLPVNLHSRRAQRQTLEAALRYRRETGGQALLHWFTQSKKLIRICGEAGIFVSAGPSVLFDDHAADVALTIPEALLLVETDSPVPFGGTPATPAWAARVLNRLAELKGVEPEALARQVAENFARFMGLT